MAQFIAKVQGTCGPSSRLGSKQSGIEAIASGWNVGAVIDIRHENGKDVVRVYQTGGSNNPTCSRLLAEFRDDDS